MLTAGRLAARAARSLRCCSLDTTEPRASGFNLCSPPRHRGLGPCSFQPKPAFPRLPRAAQFGSGGGAQSEDELGQRDSLPFQVKGLNHVAVVVPDLKAAAKHYRTVLGAVVSEPRDLPEHGVTFAVARLNDLHLELLHPLGDASPIANFLAKNPRGGLHHVCLSVDSVEGAAAHVRERGLRLLGDGVPRPGAHGDPVVFLHPKDFGGVLYELEGVGPPATEAVEAPVTGCNKGAPLSA